MIRQKSISKTVLQGWRLPVLLLLLGLSACATSARPSLVESALHYIPEQDGQRLNRYAPVFSVEAYSIAHNRIGEVRADSETAVHIDPDSPALYAEQRQFSTPRGEYTNLIYRVHFTEVPGGYVPFYLSAGHNVGLIIILTLGPENQPLLYTTVHTCGCYLAFIPTTNLPSEMLPPGWNKERQTVFGESLPACLDYTTKTTDRDQDRVQVRIRADTHRVIDVWRSTTEVRPEPSTPIPLMPLVNLKQLPINNGQTTSFYETKGCRLGHVKGSFKTRERLLMSWWALDWNIGQDKYLGTDLQDGPRFYTSLKPWARKASDLRDFAGFLKYWGWGL